MSFSPRGSQEPLPVSRAWDPWGGRPSTLPRRDSKRHVRASRSSRHIQMISGSGSWSIAVVWVAVRAPNSGTVVDTAQSRAGSIETKWTASVSPGSAFPRRMVRVWGLRNGNWQTLLTRSFSLFTFPAKQSSVNCGARCSALSLPRALLPERPDILLRSRMESDHRQPSHYCSSTTGSESAQLFGTLAAPDRIRLPFDIGAHSSAASALATNHRAFEMA